MKSSKIPSTGQERRVQMFAHFGAFFVVLTLGLFTSVRATPLAADCQKVKATEISAFTGPTTVEGTVSQGGILNGTSLSVLASDFFPTASPGVFSFLINKSFITDKGTLETSSPHILDLSTGIGTAIGNIDPNTSTGIFAGATGVLYVNFTPIDAVSSRAEVAGEICFANR